MGLIDSRDDQRSIVESANSTRSPENAGDTIARPVVIADNRTCNRFADPSKSRTELELARHDTVPPSIWTAVTKELKSVHEGAERLPVE